MPLILLMAQPEQEAPPDVPPERLAKARRLLQDAIEKGRGGGAVAGFQGIRVDKYFGSKLPPVCAQLGCYVTDDGKRFYCINPACQKHTIRETKHTRRGRPEKSRFVYFHCPRCDGREVEMHIMLNRYVCRRCKYNWQS